VVPVPGFDPVPLHVSQISFRAILIFELTPVAASSNVSVMS
jgi:hypothetical protein